MNTSNTPAPNEYLLLIRGKNWYTHLSPEEIQEAMSKFGAWFESLNAKGRIKAAQPLAREGKTVAGRPAKVIADGPFAESKEAVGGYFLLNGVSYDEAVEIAKSCPGLEYGASIDIRPVAEECPLASRARELKTEEQLVHPGA